MVAVDKSWHVLDIYRGGGAEPPSRLLDVVFLQRMSSEEQDQVLKNLKEVDKEWADALDIPASEPRELHDYPWIRDYWPSSEVILRITKSGHNKHEDGETWRSYVLVDSGWEAGNVIAARYEGPEQDERLNAARVPMDVANALLTTCDANDGFTLSRALGEEIYDEAKVDFYKDLGDVPPDQHVTSPDEFEWPICLPNSLKLPEKQPDIVALKHLTENEINQLNDAIVGTGKSSRLRSAQIAIQNWEGDTRPRKDIYHIFRQMCKNSNQSDEGAEQSIAFFVDNIQKGPNEQPQILAAWQRRVDETDEFIVHVAPIPSDRLLELWRQHMKDSKPTGDIIDDYSDIWRQEIVVDIARNGLNGVDEAPVIFLQPFTIDQERHIRNALSKLDETEEGEDWGSTYVWLGYIWPEGTQTRTMEDLRDLFESNDRFSPTWNSKQPGPYPMLDYPHNFIAVDERVFEAAPMVIQVSSLDFSPMDAQDELGWQYGYVRAEVAHINQVNFDIANIGPEEVIDDCKKLWLNDLKEYAANEWVREREEWAGEHEGSDEENAEGESEEDEEVDEDHEDEDVADDDDEGENDDAVDQDTRSNKRVKTSDE